MATLYENWISTKDLFNFLSKLFTLRTETSLPLISSNGAFRCHLDLSETETFLHLQSLPRSVQILQTIATDLNNFDDMNSNILRTFPIFCSKSLMHLLSASDHLLTFSAVFHLFPIAFFKIPNDIFYQNLIKSFQVEQCSKVTFKECISKI